MGEENDVVVTGISGRFPESANFEEFKNNLLCGKDLVTEERGRCPPNAFGIPKRGGRLKELDKFDASFFGILPEQSNFMDPQLRILLEVVFEAIFDSGKQPLFEFSRHYEYA